ncbi:MAG TPA: serine hydrolase domain-containing protein, partial [Terriglobales bacterium]|nr:serine hydrolase domain-containing protein [Terriglobales bacterium]
MAERDRRAFLKNAVASAVLVAPTAVVAESLETAPRRPSKSGETGRREQTMSPGGFSRARLGRMHDVMAGYVERGVVPGIVTLVSRRGQLHVDAIGMKAVGGNDPMRRDTIFRIASLTKPITA